ncbi:MAG: zinc-binding alcohol dehydrogenase family protein [Acidobacteriota bacterium]
MQTAVMHAPGQMQVEAWPTPVPKANEVLVSVRATGVCAGDLYLYQGKNPYASYPVVGGHEIAGVVEMLGADVVGLRVGERVVVEPFIGCGRCYPCRIGKSNCCAKLQIIGVHRAGGFAEFLTAPARNLHPIPEMLSFSVASFAEPVAIGVQACRRGNIGTGEYVLVLGCGPIGLALIEVARQRGARVVAADVQPSRLEIARQLGAETLQGGDQLLPAVLEQTRGEGAPVVIEATGSAGAVEQTVELVASGGRIVIVGLIKRGVGVTFPGLDFTRKEMTIVGSRASVNCFAESLELLASGAIEYPKVATEFALVDAPQVLAQLATNPASLHKALLVVEE